MSQRQMLQDLDATLVSAFMDAGMADAAVYTPPGGSGTACRVLVDDQVEVYGDGPGEVAGHRTLVTLFLSEIPTPRQGAQVVIAGEPTYTLVEIFERDQSRERWVVTRG